MYTTCDVTHDNNKNDTLWVNVLFVVLNSSVLLVALGKGIAHVRFFWNKISLCVRHCFTSFDMQLYPQANSKISLCVRHCFTSFDMQLYPQANSEARFPPLPRVRRGLISQTAGDNQA